MDLDDIVQSISALTDHAAIQRLSQLLSESSQREKTVLYVFFALLVGFIVGRYRAHRASRAYESQNRGEQRLTREVLANFGPPDYHLMNHITLQLDNGTTQVDHILISKFGVFVIETKHYKGWIFANAKHASWTQVLYRRRFKFQNPILQNARHVRAVRNLLDFLPSDALKSIVVFTGDAEFKTEIPHGVFTLAGFTDYLREQTTEVMSLNRVQFSVGRLETTRLAISGQTDVQHVQSLARRHGNAT